MLCACIDIGSNTTRLLVSEAREGQLTEVLQQRTFTRIGQAIRGLGEIPHEKIEEVAHVVAAHRELAESIGCGSLRVVATAAIRTAANQDEFLAALRATGGVDVTVLDGHEEARLAFLGATRTLGQDLPGQVAVVDVGGGSTEIAVGTLANGVAWSASFPVGSGLLTDRYLHSDPPSAAEMQAMREHAAKALDGQQPPQPDCAVAVGGSAASLRRLVGATLEPGTMQSALDVLAGAPAEEVAQRFTIDPQRVRLLAAGILVLDAAAHKLGCPLQIGRGGVREGVLLEIARSME
jgi:exopolyphosphatase/guanosine-5'-triphosphate,3'-diphosphate pyrophosphatase